jgi:hypothetical protein
VLFFDFFLFFFFFFWPDPLIKGNAARRGADALCGGVSAKKKGKGSRHSPGHLTPSQEAGEGARWRTCCRIWRARRPRPGEQEGCLLVCRRRVLCRSIGYNCHTHACMHVLLSPQPCCCLDSLHHTIARSIDRSARSAPPHHQGVLGAEPQRARVWGGPPLRRQPRHLLELRPGPSCIHNVWYAYTTHCAQHSQADRTQVHTSVRIQHAPQSTLASDHGLPYKTIQYCRAPRSGSSSSSSGPCTCRLCSSCFRAGSPAR